jgi:hypothetical protein
VEPAARPSAVSVPPGRLEAFEFIASSGPSFLSHLAGAQAQVRACVPPRGSCTLAFIKAPVVEALFPKSSIFSVFHGSSNASTQPIVRADAQRQAATGPHFILGLARPAVVRRSTQTLGVTRNVMNIPSSRNPSVATSRNPFVATSLNPNVATSLNPNVATSRNPFVATSLNPRVATSHNPRVATSLNYQVATSINPNVATSLNPRVATSRNPNVVSNIDGLYIWDLNLGQVGFTVRANDRVQLLFDASADFTGVLISVRDDYLNEYDLNNEWSGYWLHASDNTWLRYTLQNTWHGFTT